MTVILAGETLAGTSKRLLKRLADNTSVYSLPQAFYKSLLNPRNLSISILQLILSTSRDTLGFPGPPSHPTTQPPPS
jgi:hypothetical protein